ncbi:4-alpha-glucanotransferase [Autumnicola musiva]|uniref:4-alpha-glucanotransferase n=1 Tax=Autumnicola musiva TaxID=3075589 RepID=A0ABU3D783_9FLAO|nr:4-alpha-glucanotransferase [Zunongwangia sp. F117]MDT0676863.1 4-alpha-glucanotransferase [Zunongwangia sp. F117]
MDLHRSSGILLHITSLPSDYGIGDLGKSAYEFVDFLEDSGYHYWQLLPLNPTHSAYYHSPYSSYSAFAGNPLLISPELLEKEGYLDSGEISKPKGVSNKKVKFEAVETYKVNLLNTAFENYRSKKAASEEFKKFCNKHRKWLEDFAIFQVFTKKYGRGWTGWPKEIKNREDEAIKKAYKDFAEEIEKEKFFQYIFFQQWEALVRYAHKNNVAFIGDIPFYVNHESADCWAHTEYFKLNEEKEPTHVSGVPPDYFSETGQLWGTPVFNWKVLKSNDFDWWVERLTQNLLLFDVVRLDHFRAFSAYWEVPAKEETAINGKWIKTPGTQFFSVIKKKFPKMPFIAEDLGSLDEPVYKLLQKFDFPGMNVLHFAFGEEKADNPYLPFNHKPHSLVYTGTHDNNTTRGWFGNLDKEAKKHLKKYSGRKISEENVHEIMRTMALKSVSKIAVFPLQDLIGMGEEAIMNTPGTIKNNWTWRVKRKEIPFSSAKDFRKQNILFGRFKEPEIKKKSDKKK